MSRLLSLIFVVCTTCLSYAQTTSEKHLFKHTIVQFGHDESHLTEEEASRLNSLTAALDTLMEVEIEIEAHTDGKGSAAYNDRLSSLRAMTIKNYLMGIGVDSALIQESAYGEYKAIASNDSESGRAMNRRADVRVLYTPKPKKVPKPIYEAVVVSGRTVKAEDGAGIEAKVEVSGKSFNAITHSDSTGYFEVEVPKGAVLKFISTPDSTDYFTSTVMAKMMPDVIDKGVVLASKYLKSKTISGVLKDEYGELLKEGSIIYQWGDHLNQTVSDDEGKFEIVVPEEEVVRISAFFKDYFYDGIIIKQDEFPDSIQLQLPKIEEGRRYVADDILFVGDRDIVLPTSQIHLSSLKKVIELAEDYCFKIEGHINLPNTPQVRRQSSHFDLSERRAERIYKFLLNNGVEDERICFEGFGNWRMRFPAARNEHQMMLNRRVEVQVIACDN